MWTNPSTPGNNSTNAPKDINLTTLPSNTSPAFILSACTFHGSLSTSFNISETLSCSASTSPTNTVTLSPSLTTSSTLFTLSQAKSLM